MEHSTSASRETWCAGYTSIRRTRYPASAPDTPVDRLVWFEVYDHPRDAIAREKLLKKWRRDWKIRLIEEQNPD
jgi:predicted GIY-YIG superfamily endonuclease